MTKKINLIGEYNTKGPNLDKHKKDHCVNLDKLI
jgi:hypothetical protein